jgi:hypothetical protein
MHDSIVDSCITSKFNFHRKSGLSVLWPWGEAFVWRVVLVSRIEHMPTLLDKDCTVHCQLDELISGLNAYINRYLGVRFPLSIRLDA